MPFRFTVGPPRNRSRLCAVLDFAPGIFDYVAIRPVRSMSFVCMPPHMGWTARRVSPHYPRPHHEIRTKTWTNGQISGP